MNIAGLQKTTLLDFPGKVAATIFTSSCNMRCSFCHNMDIVTNPVSNFTKEEVTDFLKKRSGILEGVCITGGEPTLWPDLYDFVETIKNMGYATKLDTNGTSPEVLSRLLDAGLLDYVAMDIKTSLAEYPTVCKVSDIDVSKIKKSVNILVNSSIDYEFRTTMIESYHTPTVMEDIGILLKGARNYYLQGFIDSDYVPDHDLCAPSKETLLSYVEMLQHYIDNVSLRGID